MYRRYELSILFVASLVFLLSIVSPPGLMDDVDAVQAQIARTMLESGDWVTAKLNGIRYFEKPPFKYWMIASSFALFGISDWAARLPVALGVVALCWLTFRLGRWAFDEKSGFYAGLIISTSVGLFLFTRILISDSLLTLTITLTLWSFLRAIDEEERFPRLWAALMALSIAIGILLKGLIAAVFPSGAIFLYLLLTGQLFKKQVWSKLHPFTGIAILLLVAAPWHILATLKNPPYFNFSLTSGPGQYRGFFWFYFFNEHILRFLGRRYPRDYNTVPRLLFWLLHLVWFFPWSSFFPTVTKLKFTLKPETRAEKMRLLSLCLIGLVMSFFTLSTTQEYYSMPIYPMVALLLGNAISNESRARQVGIYAISSISVVIVIVISTILFLVKDTAVVGDISSALLKNENVEIYTLSLGHMGDLTLQSFAHLKLPLILAGFAFLVGCTVWRWREFDLQVLTVTGMMVIFYTAARLALMTFEPYMGSRPLAEALTAAPSGQVILDNQYYTFSSVFFYAHPKDALLLNGRVNNLEYGSNAPASPKVFIDDAEFKQLWQSPKRHYLLIEKDSIKRLQPFFDTQPVYKVTESGGKVLLTNKDPKLNL